MFSTRLREFGLSFFFENRNAMIENSNNTRTPECSNSHLMASALEATLASAAAKQAEIDKLRRAFGIAENRPEGAAFQEFDAPKEEREKPPKAGDNRFLSRDNYKPREPRERRERPQRRDAPPQDSKPKYQPIERDYSNIQRSRSRDRRSRSRDRSRRVDSRDRRDNRGRSSSREPYRRRASPRRRDDMVKPCSTPR